MSTMTTANGGPPTKKFKKAELTLADRRSIFFTCVNALQGGGFCRGFWSELSSNLPVAPRTVSHNWQKMRQEFVVRCGPINSINTTTMMATTPDDFFATNKKKTGQNSRKITPEEIGERLKTVPWAERQTVEATAKAIGVVTKTFHRQFRKEGAAVKHSSALRPFLTAQNMQERIWCCLDKIDRSTINKRGDRKMRYQGDFDEVNVDEKWFNLSHEGNTYYLAPDEKPPDRRCKHKGYIDKVMFLSAVARPRMLPDGSWWDGKIGIWPFGKHEPAKRDSINRPKGTLEWKNESVDAEVHNYMMMDHVVPAIVDKWPAGDWRNPRMAVRIQQDGAPGHIKEREYSWLEYVESMGLSDKIKLFNQPPNSPDLNINDLGFFRAIEAAHKKQSPKNYDDIIELVTKTHWEYPHNKINRMFLTRMQVMQCILDNNGDNAFKITHMAKAKLEREGRLPDVLEVTESAYRFLQNAPNTPNNPPRVAAAAEAPNNGI